MAGDRYFSRGLSLVDISREFRVSPAYLGQLFFRQAGQTFHEYLSALRIEKAKELLEDPLLTVKEVASRVGYEDPSNFVRAFRLALKVTPRRYSQEVQLRRLGPSPG